MSTVNVAGGLGLVVTFTFRGQMLLPNVLHRVYGKQFFYRSSVELLELETLLSYHYVENGLFWSKSQEQMLK
jgi:hypothetical protein